MSKNTSKKPYHSPNISVHGKLADFVQMGSEGTSADPSDFPEESPPVTFAPSL